MRKPIAFAILTALAAGSPLAHPSDVDVLKFSAYPFDTRSARSATPAHFSRQADNRAGLRLVQFTDTLIKRDGRWQLAAGHVSRIEK